MLVLLSTLAGLFSIGSSRALGNPLWVIWDSMWDLFPIKPCWWLF